MAAVAKRDALIKRKSYALVMATKEKSASTAGLKNVRNAPEWKRDWSCARDRDQNLI